MSEKHLIVAYLFGSLNRGGTETMLLDCFRNSKQAEYFFIGIHRKDGDLLDNFIDTGVPFFKLGIKHSLDIGYFFRLRKVLLSHSVNIVHAEQPLDAFLSWISLMGTGIKILLTIHGYDFSENWLSKFLIRFILKRTNLNVFVSKSQMNYYVKSYGLAKSSGNIVIYNGISFSKFKNSQIKSLRDELGLNANSLLLCSVGNFVPVRDPMVICRFLSLLKRKNVDFIMLFAGSKSTKTPRIYDDCVSYCKKEGMDKNVLFLGSRNDIPDILHQCEAFIYASQYDTFGIGVIEAISSGIPVFVNDWDVMKEVTENGEYATLYRTGDEYNLLGSFWDFLENSELYNKISRNSSLEIRKRFSIEQHIYNLNITYRSLFKM